MRRTLVDLLNRDIARADCQGPDWVTAVTVAIDMQDMEWELDVWTAAAQQQQRSDGHLATVS